MGRRLIPAIAAIALVLLAGLAAPAAAAVPDSIYEPTVTPASALPGTTVTVVFPPGMELGWCVAGFAFADLKPGESCPESIALVVPEAEPRPKIVPLWWAVSGGRVTHGENQPPVGLLTFTVLADETVSPSVVVSRSSPETSASPGRPEIVETTFGVSVTPGTAPAGSTITAEVFPNDPGVHILGCLVAFPGDAGAACRLVGGRWLADVPVPRNTPPGSNDVRWGVRAATDTGRAIAQNSTIRFPVAAPPATTATTATAATATAGTTAPVVPPPRTPQRPPAFTVRPEPAAGRTGDHVTVSPLSLVDGVTITGCAVGFGPGMQTPCRRDTGGWAADVAVPDEAKPGPGTLLWRVGYERDGASGSADGLLSFTVLNPPPDGSGLPGILWRAALFGALTGLLLAGRRVWKKMFTHPDPAVDVVALTRPDQMTVAVTHTDRWPVTLVVVTPAFPEAT